MFDIDAYAIDSHLVDVGVQQAFAKHALTRHAGRADDQAVPVTFSSSFSESWMAASVGAGARSASTSIDNKIKELGDCVVTLSLVCGIIKEAIPDVVETWEARKTWFESPADDHASRLRTTTNRGPSAVHAIDPAGVRS